MLHDSALTAVASLPSGEALLGDAMGSVLLARGAEATPLERTCPTPTSIASLVTNHAWWAAHDDAGRLEVWEAGGAPVYYTGQSFTFVAFEDESVLTLGLGGGNGVRRELPRGVDKGAFSVPRAGQPLYVRHAEGRGAVFAWPRGPILVTAGQGLTCIVQEILAVLHAEPSQHIGAFADTTGKLGVFRWQP